MVELTTASAHDVSILSFLVTSERFEQKSYELAATVAEINIYEHVDIPFLTATALIIDTADILNLVNFQGTEKVRIRVKLFGDPTALEVEKNFIVTDIQAVAPGGDTTEGLSLNLLEDHAYLDRLNVVSKAYSGKPEKIIENLLMDNLKKEITNLKTKENQKSTFEESSQPPIKIIVPNWSTLDTVRWVKDRTCTANSMPFFLYSTLNDDKLIMTNLAEMLSTPPINNPDRDYTFSQAYTRYSIEKTVLEQSYIIQAYSLTKSEDMMGLINNGTVSSEYNFIDTTIEQDPTHLDVNINMEQILEDMVSRNIITDGTGPIYDKDFKLNEKTLAGHRPSVLSQLVTSNTFPEHANYYESPQLSEHRAKATARALRHYLLKSPIDIVVPGYNFLGRGENTSIGRKIRLVFLKNDQRLADAGKPGDEAKDKKRSGVYLIYAARHVIRPERYDVSMTCAKLANLEET